MKKLRVKAMELGAKEVLTRTQLKNVLGGNGGTTTTTAVHHPSCQLYCESLGIIYRCYEPNCYFDGNGSLHCKDDVFYCTKFV